MNPEFENRYWHHYEELTEYLITSGFEEGDVRRYCSIFLNRLLMLFFIQRQGWLDGNAQFLQWYLDQYQQSSNSESFHFKWLDTLLFKVFNTPPCARVLNPDLPEEVCNALRRIPYLNDTLFRKVNLDNKNAQIPDRLLMSIITNFSKFEFTIKEQQLVSNSGSLDPSILSHIHQLTLVQGTQEDEGVVYTPKSEVDLICRIALYNYIVEGSVLSLTSSEKIELDKLRSLENHHALFDLVFTTPKNRDSTKIHGKSLLTKLLCNVRIIDPACGSGALLVGMLLLLIEILEKLGETPDYQIRANLVRKCIHGADLDEWAIRLTEFRLWLVIAQGYAPSLRQPVLPNLGLNLIVGDSVVQQVNKQHFTLNGFRGNISEKVDESLKKLEQLAEQYFAGDLSLLEDIHYEQLYLVEAFLKDSACEPPNQNLTDLLKHLLNLNERIFLWDLSFPHIMLRGGFDIAVVNPPYVRSEQIGRNVEYKQALHAYVQTYHKKIVSGRSDLYVYFFFKILETLQSGGCFVFITSNSWLDVDFGLTLQEKLLDSTELRFLLEFSSTRAFRDSLVNTVITAGIKRKGPILGETLFLTLKEPYHFTSHKSIKKGFFGLNSSETVTISGVPVEISENNQVKRVSIKTESLSHVGVGKWGRLLRASAVFFKISERTDNLLVPLRELAEVKRGLTTGTNEFFYLPKPGTTNKYFQAKYESSTGSLLLSVLPEASDSFDRQGFTIRIPMFRIEKEYWMHKVEDDKSELMRIYEIVFDTGDSLWVPNYLVKGPKEINTILVAPSELKHVVLLVHGPKEKLEPGIQDYLRWGELYEPESGGRYPTRSTCRSRALWYDLGLPTPPDLLWIKGVWERHLVALANRMCYIDQQLYGIYLNKPSLLYTTLGTLNSTLIAFFAELTGRSNLGEGVLWTAIYEAESIPTLKEPDSKIIGIVNKVLSKPIRSILDDIGSHNPDTITLSQIEPNRRALDSLIMGKILSLNEQEQLQVYHNVVNLVTSRLKKAKSKIRTNLN